MAALLSACGASSPPPPGDIAVEITHRFGTQPLQLHDRDYTTANGDVLRVDKLRYYLSNVRLHEVGGQWFTAPGDARSSRGYYLVDAADPDSLHFRIEGVPAGEYDGIELLLGLDAARNHAGAQSGTLDPARGLFWTWKSGYIFFQLEGRSAQSSAAAQALIYHLGSVDAQDRARSVYLPLKPQSAQLRPGIAPEIHLHVDLAELFGGAHSIRIAELNTVMGDAAGSVLSDNLPGLFRVDHVHNEPARRAHAP